MSGDPHGAAPAVILYQTEDGQTRVQCRFEGETLWLTQAQLAELFQITVATVNEHLKALATEGELDLGATSRKLRIVRTEGPRRPAQTSEQVAPSAFPPVATCKADSKLGRRTDLRLPRHLNVVDQHRDSSPAVSVLASLPDRRRGSNAAHPTCVGKL